MEKTAIFAVSLALLLLFGCASNENQQTPQPSPTTGGIPSAPPQVVKTQTPNENATNNTTQQVAGGTQSREREGYVDRNEIGGEGLKVISFFKLEAEVSSDGSFVTQTSTVGAQMVFVNDKDSKVRATAIALPEDTQPLVFDAASTAKAALWVGGSLKQEDAESRLNSIEKLSCYPSLYAYLKANLKQKSYSEINNFSNSDYISLVTNCTQEIMSGPQGYNPVKG